MNIKIADQAVQDTATTALGGLLLACIVGFWAWARKLVGMPKRVRRLEATSDIVLQTLGAQNKFLLAQNQRRRDADKSPEMLAAEEGIREADAKMEAYLRGSLTGVKE